MNKKVIVIGGGPAGMQAASTLRKFGIKPTIIERSARLGGKLNEWHKLFPSLTPASEVLDNLKNELSDVELMTGSEVETITDSGVILTDGQKINSDAVIIASGFEVFNAKLKEEYGYGIYDNVYTSVDVERMLNEQFFTLSQGPSPSRIAFLHCVGSRDEKVNQRHCSRVCCITGVKQAMELKKIYPEASIYNFYMDIRMFGPGYEEMYRQAQEEFNIHFIRGRISEASETMDKLIQIKAEDTLIGRPLKMTVDMLVLVVGMTAGNNNKRFASHNSIRLYNSGFIMPEDQFTYSSSSQAKNIFYAGTVTAPKNIGESINEGTSAAVKVIDYLNSI